MSIHETQLLAYATLDRHKVLMAAIDNTTHNGDRPMPQIQVREVTKPMLEDFHAEAVRAGDTDMQVICNRALMGEKPAIDEVSEAVADIHAMGE